MMPPTTPPIRAALPEDLLPVLAGVIVWAFVAEAARTLLVWSAVVSAAVDDVVEEVVCTISEVVDDDVALVLLAISLVLLVGSALDVDVDEELANSSSGQIPVVQGSLEQHPW